MDQKETIFTLPYDPYEKEHPFIACVPFYACNPFTEYFYSILL